VCAPLEGLQRVEEIDSGHVLDLSTVLDNRLDSVHTESVEVLVDRWFTDPSLLRIGLAIYGLSLGTSLFWRSSPE
jgi:hypothetical protein